MIWIEFAFWLIVLIISMTVAYLDQRKLKNDD